MCALRTAFLLYCALSHSVKLNVPFNWFVAWKCVVYNKTAAFFGWIFHLALAYTCHPLVQCMCESMVYWNIFGRVQQFFCLNIKKHWHVENAIKIPACMYETHNKSKLRHAHHRNGNVYSTHTMQAGVVAAGSSSIRSKCDDAQHHYACTSRLFYEYYGPTTTVANIAEEKSREKERKIILLNNITIAKHILFMMMANTFKSLVHTRTASHSTISSSSTLDALG